MSDDSAQLVDAVRYARARQQTLAIAGLGSRAAVAPIADGAVLNVAEHRGILRYQPEELVVTVRAGTPVREVIAELARHRQMLAFEPTSFARDGSIGGMIAADASGASRPFAGGVRDALLGVEIINGLGEQGRFGGEVMKNVAGYDVARLQCGARGSCGVLLSASLRVAPIPDCERYIRRALAVDEVCAAMSELRSREPSLTGLAYADGVLQVRVAGSEPAVKAASARIPGDGGDSEFWRQISRHAHPNLSSPPASGGTLWRVSSAPNAPLTGDELLVDWAGGVRWLALDSPPRQATSAPGGWAMAVGGNRAGSIRGLDQATSDLLSRVRLAFDPDSVFAASSNDARGEAKAVQG
ncbi:MAG: glycolate oxidase subunit GlcE [Pseudomonadaceae bacterium]|nr:glycolate oxidase subunit GlcE [Pseudomonadaceae bacterium]